MLDIHYFNDAWQPDPDGLNWRAAAPAEVGASVVVNAAWVRWGVAWGTSSFKIVAWDKTHPLGEADTRQDYWRLPAGTRFFTAEGRRQRADTVVSVSLLQQAK